MALATLPFRLIPKWSTLDLLDRFLSPQILEVNPPATFKSLIVPQWAFLRLFDKFPSLLILNGSLTYTRPNMGEDMARAALAVGVLL